MLALFNGSAAPVPGHTALAASHFALGISLRISAPAVLLLSLPSNIVLLADWCALLQARSIAKHQHR